MGPMRKFAYEYDLSVSYTTGCTPERRGAPADFCDDVTAEAVEEIRQSASIELGNESDWEVVSGYGGPL